ncbi:MAG: DegV family protein [Chloroflexota bacterium]|nr:DegV family protein [Chloroflexota bacterium]
MSVAIVTDSASDLTAELAAEHGITVVPLVVTFGEESFLSGVELSMEDFYRRLTAPDAPFPKTAACSPGDFAAAFRAVLDQGHEAVVCITVGAKLSGTMKAAEIACEGMSDAAIHLIDSGTASMQFGLLVLRAAEMARDGATAEEIVSELHRRLPASKLYVALDTLEYLKRGGRISGAQAAIGSVLSVKPIITIADGVVETADKPRTRNRARQRLIELLASEPVERAWVMHAQAPDMESFSEELATALGLPRAAIGMGLIGPSVAPHVGPGAYGAAVLRRIS